jgi:predicted AAA+ superfamily ATPase
MKNDYMTAEQARHYSTKKLIDDFPEECKQELIEQIERTAMSGERSIIFIDEVFSVESFAPYLKKGYKQFLESLGYKVELNSTVINVNEKTVASHCLEISW